MCPDSLPPKPNRRGEPRPPPAPRVVDPGRPRRYEPNPRHHTHEREGTSIALGLQNPLLESVHARRPDRWSHAAIVTASLFALPTPVIGLVVWSQAGWAGQALLEFGGFMAVLALVVFVFSASRNPSFAIEAGAHAVAEIDTTGEGVDVPLYRLDSVTVVDHRRRGLALRLVHGSSTLVLPFGMIEANQQLWDLVYNGVVHSISAGATTDARTRRVLRLPDTDK